MKGAILIMGFIDTLKERAKANVKTIVLPETEDKSYRENFKRRNCKGYPCW
jgi:phosphotransacetylase